MTCTQIFYDNMYSRDILIVRVTQLLNVLLKLGQINYKLTQAQLV